MNEDDDPRSWRMQGVWLASLIVLVGLGASRESQGVCPMDKEVAWVRARLDLGKAKDSETAARLLESLRRRCGLPLDLWAGPDVDESQTIAHPCDGVVERFIKVVPSPTDPIARPERVYEYAPTGEVIAEWWVPIESRVKAIEGEQLLLHTWIDHTEQAPPFLVVVRSKGSFQIVPSRETPEPNVKECPKDLPDSEFLTCYEFVDQATGVVRRIAYEGPCT
jgi:hypothetical protein